MVAGTVDMSVFSVPPHTLSTHVDWPVLNFPTFEEHGIINQSILQPLPLPPLPWAAGTGFCPRVFPLNVNECERLFAVIGTLWISNSIFYLIGKLIIYRHRYTGSTVYRRSYVRF